MHEEKFKLALIPRMKIAKYNKYVIRKLNI